MEIRFNRPHRLNAAITELYAETMDALAESERDPDVWVVVLTGEGRAFCVGADLKEHGKGERTELEKLEYLQLGNDVCERIYRFPKIVIAAVNGFALGAGAGMSCSPDFILMKQGAQIGFPEMSIGTFVGGGVSGVLPEARALAARIAKNPPHQLRMAKRLLREGLNSRLDTVLELAAAYQGACHQTDDHEESVNALLENREAVFSGT